MFTFDTGLFPLVAIVIGALFTLIFFGMVRLKCSARWAIGFIFASMAVITICSMVTPVRWVELDTAVEVLVEPEETVLTPIKEVGYTTEQAMPSVKVKAKEPIVSDSPAVKPFLHDASRLFGWLWVAGVVVMLLSLIWQLRRLYLLRRNQELVSRTDVAKLFAVDGTDAFSFGRSVFIPRMFDKEMRQFMTLHEIAHVRHHHFLWLCLCWILVAINWYNPFCWVLFRELHLQQELQVDSDVLRQGVDRSAYQYSLLRASMQGGGPVWVLSAFGRNPVTHRIAFMNSDINMQGSVRRAVVSSLLAVVVLSVAVITACQNNEKVKEHPLMGWWKMDFTRNTDSDTELYPIGKQIAFYNYDTFLTITYQTRNGKSLYFSFSTEETKLKGDTLVDAMSTPMRYKFIDDNTFQNHWTRQPYQKAMPQGPEITDQWSRIPVDEELLELFETLRQADKAHGGKFDGVWLDLTQTVTGDKAKEYLIVSDSLFLSLNYHRQEPKAFRAAGSGYSGVLKEYGEYIQLGSMAPLVYSMPDADHLEVRDATNEQATRYFLQRIDMPADLKRMLTAPLTHEHFDYSRAKEVEQSKEAEKQALRFGSTDNDIVFDVCEQLPTFPGGDVELMKWLSNHIKYPKEAEESGVQGRVIVAFIVSLRRTAGCPLQK